MSIKAKRNFAKRATKASGKARPHSAVHRKARKSAASPSQDTKTKRLPAAAGVQRTSTASTKVERISELLERRAGATVEALMVETGWQSHSVRAALSGLRKRGMKISRTKHPNGGPSTYHAVANV
ncbi:MAG: DUF3489 domain-containing protein [Alphaproteobacteria bacterium]